MVMVYKVTAVTYNVHCVTTNWNKWFLCQVDTPEVLRCSAYSKHDAEGLGYKTITGNTNGFRYGWLLALLNQPVLVG